MSALLSLSKPQRQRPHPSPSCCFSFSWSLILVVTGFVLAVVVLAMDMGLLQQATVTTSSSAIAVPGDVSFTTTTTTTMATTIKNKSTMFRHSDTTTSTTTTSSSTSWTTTTTTTTRRRRKMIILNTTTALQNQTLIRMALQQQGLYLSLQQYDHYHQQGQTLFRHLVHGKGQQGVVVVDLQALLYPSPHARLGLLLHPRLAYRNIYKTGSTTIAANMNHNNNNNNHHHHHGRHLTLPQLTRLPWLVVVRDPLEHFLSGWGECGQRRVVQTETESWPYNKRILHWLNRTRERAKGGQQCHALSRKQESYNNNNNKKNNKKKTFSNRVLQECLCAVHSLAQVNYLYNQDKGDLYDNVAVVGDLRELPGLLQVVGAPLPSSSTTSNTTLSSIGRNSSLYAWRNVYPRRLDWLSNETLLELCRFLMLDYALLNYTPPAICREELFAEWSRII